MFQINARYGRDNIQNNNTYLQMYMTSSAMGFEGLNKTKLNR